MSEQSQGLTAWAVAQLTLDGEPYLSCDDCFEQVDTHIEGLISADVPLPPPFRAHLLGCAACREEAWSLAELAAPSLGVSQAAARSRLEQALALDEDSPA